MIKRFENSISNQNSTFPLAIFRILFAAIMLVEIGSNFYFRKILFNDVWLLPDGSVMITILFIINLISLCSILIGYKIYAASIINYLVVVLFIGGGKAHGVDWHADALFIIGSLLLVIIPSGDYFSIDSVQHTAEKKASCFYTALLILPIGTMYFDSIFWKLSSPMHLSGLGFWAPVSLPYNIFWDMSFILAYEGINKFMGYFVIFFEFTFILFIWFKKIRLVYIVLGLIFHLAIMISFPIPNFSIVMIAFLLGIVPFYVYEMAFGFLNIKIKSKSKSIRSNFIQVNKNLALSILVFWLGSFFLISFKSPIYRTYLFDEPAPLLKLTERIASRYKDIVYPWTGLSDTGLFVDKHFAEYDTQYMLIFKNNSNEQILPLTSEEGISIGYNFNRTWAAWIFRAVSPLYPADKGEKNIEAYAGFWWEKQENDYSGEIIILERSVDVSLTEWEPNLLAKNLDEPWVQVGYVEFDQSQFDVVWTDGR